MALTTDEVRKIAMLARLRLTPREEDLFAQQLGQVVDYIDQLGRYAPAAGASGSPAGDAGTVSATEATEATEATATVEPAGHDAADTVAPCLPRELFLANAPASMDGFLLVPEVKASEEA